MPQLYNGQATGGASNDKEKLFVNAFKITGIKHIADNILHAVLQGLPQWLVFNYRTTRDSYLCY